MRALILVLTMFCQGAFASCFPETGMKIYRNSDIHADAISHQHFDLAIDKVLKHYGPAVKALGYTLVFNRLWDDPTVNSDTTTQGSNWVINSYGGLARYRGMDTVQAYAAVACHELGHHMGGAPLFSDWSGMSVEGEADYWSEKDCMKGIGYGPKTAAGAALALSKVLADLGREPVPSSSTPDATVQTTTEEDHPNSQCRLDTYLSAIACPARGPMSDNDPTVNACYTYPTDSTYGSGSRPRCWFAPN